MWTRPLQEQFLAAVTRMLRPVVRQVMSFGLTYPVLDELLRTLFVDVAERDFALEFKRQTDSRVSLLTGLHRKEIARLRHQPRDPDAPPPVEDTLITRVIGRWMAGPPFADRRGRPRPLLYESSRPRDPSFARLVRDRSLDVPVRSVLDELLRLDVVEIAAGGEVVLRQEAHLPSEEIKGKLTLLGSDPGELFSTIVHNIEQPDAPWFQRKVVYDNVGAEALEDLRREARQAGEEFIRRANSILSAYDRDRNADAPGGERTRVVLGAYYFEESTSPPAPAAVSKEKSRPLPGRISRSR